MKFEGGFQGRTNKLVDSCYSFWQAGMFPIIHSILAKGSYNKKKNKLFVLINRNFTKFNILKDSIYLQENKNWLFDRSMLQSYILICCQLNCGGIIDKPGK